MAKRYGIAVLAACACLGAAHADEPQSYTDAVGDKLLRGASNIAYGWMEIPKNMVNEVGEHGAWYAPWGLGKGLAYMASRMATGVADLATFPLPSETLAQPARVWDTTDKESSFFGMGENP